MKNKKAIVVYVILGLLALIFLPKFTVTRLFLIPLHPMTDGRIYYNKQYEDTNLSARRWMNLAMQMATDQLLYLPAAARLYSYTASVYADTLETTKSEMAAGVATEQILRILYPQEKETIDRYIRNMQLYPQPITSGPVFDVVERYKERIQKDNFNLIWDKKTPGNKSWAPPKGKEDPYAMAGNWLTWNILPTTQIVIPSPPPINSIQERSEEAFLHLATSDRQPSDIELFHLWQGSTGYRLKESPDMISPAGVWQNILFTEIGNTVSNTEYAKAQKQLSNAIADATILTWREKYSFWRPHPLDDMPALDVAVENPLSPSYPSEYAAIAVTARNLLTSLFPGKEQIWGLTAHDMLTARIRLGIAYPTDARSGEMIGNTVTPPQQKTSSVSYSSFLTRFPPVTWVLFELARMDDTITFITNRITSRIHALVFPTYFTNVTDRALAKTGNLAKKVGVVPWQGVVVLDYDNDGRDDIFIPGNKHNVLLKNMGDGTFKDVSEEAGIATGSGIATSAVAGDLNNDGAIDIIVGNGHSEDSSIEGTFREGQGGLTIWENQLKKTGKPTFKDITTEAFPKYEFPDQRPGKRYVRGLALGDVDMDGCLDIYQANFVDMNFIDFDTLRHRGSKNILWHNRCDGNGIHFDDITDQAATDGSLGGVPQNPKFFAPPGVAGLTMDSAGHPVGELNANLSLATIFTDINGDGKPDLIVANDLPGPFLIFRNDSTPGNIRFTNITGNLAVMGSWMGIDSADLNGSGMFDIFLTNAGARHLRRFPHELLKNLGNGQFQKLATTMHIKPDPNLPNYDRKTDDANLTSYDWGWGTKIFDFDNDGKDDIFYFGALGNFFYEEVNGQIRLRNYYPRNINPGRFFKNLGHYNFEEISSRAGVFDIYKPEIRGMNAVESANGVAMGDFNNDGFPDLVLSHGYVDGSTPAKKTPIYIFQNRGNHNHWLKIKLTGTLNNTSASGAKVEVTTKTEKQVKEVKTGVGYASGSTLTLFFGLGKEPVADEIKVIWPPVFKGSDSIGVHTQTVSNIHADQLLSITETVQK